MPPQRKVPKQHPVFYPALALVVAFLAFFGLVSRLGFTYLNAAVALAMGVAAAFAISKWDA